MGERGGRREGREVGGREVKRREEREMGRVIPPSGVQYGSLAP